MSYSIGITVIDGQPVITGFSGELPAGTAFSISGHEPLSGYARRSVGLSVYGNNSTLLASAGAAVDLPPAGARAPLVPVPDPPAPAEVPAPAEALAPAEPAPVPDGPLVSGLL